MIKAGRCGGCAAHPAVAWAGAAHHPPAIGSLVFAPVACLLVALAGLVLPVGAARAIAGSRVGAPANVWTATTPAPVVVIGFGGVRWSDVDVARTPALWSLARRGAIGDAAVRSVRTTTCPADGWLTLSAGRRAADAVVEGAPVKNKPPCQALAAADGRGEIAAWPRYLAAARAEDYGATQ